MYTLNLFKCMRSVVQPSPEHTSRTFSSSQPNLCTCQIITPHPNLPSQPLATPGISVSGNLTVLSGIIQYLAFYVRLISLNISMFKRFIHAVACIRMSFAFKDEQYSVVCVCHALFIHSSLGGCLDCFHFLTIQIMLL